MAFREIKPNPELDALNEELIDLRVKRVILTEALKPNLKEIELVTRRVVQVEALIAQQHRRA